MTHFFDLPEMSQILTSYELSFAIEVVKFGADKTLQLHLVGDDPKHISTCFNYSNI